VKRLRLNWIFIALSVLFLSQGGRLWAGTFVEFSKNGRIDWTNGILESDGVGCPPPSPENQAQARAMARAGAVKDARERLLLLIENIRIDGSKTVGHILSQGNNERKEINVHAYVRAAEVVDLLFRPDGHVEATVAMRLSPEFLETVLPLEIKVIRQVLQPSHSAAAKPNGWSGIVIDCRGIRLLPCLVPRVVDEEGETVYGPAYISRDHAAKRRVAAYVRGIKGICGLERVGAKPLVLKAIRTQKQDSTVAVISKLDARKVLDNPLNLKLLHHCRVVFVLD